METGKIITDFDDDIEDFRQLQENVIMNTFREVGEIMPFCTILGKFPDGGLTMAYFPIVGELISNNAFKDFLIDVIIPTMQKHLKLIGATPIAISYGSEAWIRKWNIKDGPMPDNYKDILPAQGVIIMTIETEFKSRIYSWEIEGDTPDSEKIGDMSREERGKKKLTPMFKDKDDDKELNFKGGRFYNLFGNKGSKN